MNYKYNDYNNFCCTLKYPMAVKKDLQSLYIELLSLFLLEVT